MNVKKIMTTSVVSLPINATIHDAAVKMRDYNIGTVLIMTDDGALEGIITDRDIALAVAAECRDPQKVCAYEIMMDEPVIIQSDADIDTALRLMNQANVRRLPVCEEGRVIGLLSSADIATEIKEEFNQFLGLEEAFAKRA